MIQNTQTIKISSIDCGCVNQYVNSTETVNKTLVTNFKTNCNSSQLHTLLVVTYSFIENVGQVLNLTQFLKKLLLIYI